MASTFEIGLAKYGLLDSESRHYEEKKKQDIDTLWGTNGKSLNIPLGAWDTLPAITGASENFSIPRDVYEVIGLKPRETCQGGVLKMTVFNDSETDFLSLRIAKFKLTEDEKAHMKELDPETNFETVDVLGDPATRLLRVHEHRDTSPIYTAVKTIPIPPKQLVVLDKRFLAPIYMKGASPNNKYFAYGVRLDFDTKIQVKVEIHKKVYNVNTD